VPGPVNITVIEAFIWAAPCYSKLIDALNISRAFFGGA
jgi:hypothetical protein